MATLQEFVNQAWQDHATDAAAVMGRLPDGLALAAEAGHLPALAGIITHVAGEHLGRFADGDELLGKLLALGLCPEDAPEAKAVWRSRAVLARCAGDGGREAEFAARARNAAGLPEASDRIRILATAAAALAAHGKIAEAGRDLEEAVSLAGYGPGKEDPAAMALAATGNNLSAALEEKEQRTDAETRLMLAAATIARRFWEVAGDWTNVERAEYRLSAAHLAAGDARTALDHAETCLRICAANAAPPFEAFFGQERLALAHHALGQAHAAGAACAAMRALLLAMDADDRAYGEGELLKVEMKVGQAPSA